MKKYTLIAKQHFSGVTSIAIGDEIKNLTPQQVRRYLKADSAVFKTKKELDIFNTEFEYAEKSRLKKEAEATAIIRQDELKNELNLICIDAVAKVAEIGGIVLSEEETSKNVESIIEFLSK